jgi:hypothetical protein
VHGAQPGRPGTFAGLRAAERSEGEGAMQPNIDIAAKREEPRRLRGRSSSRSNHRDAGRRRFSRPFR